jgi:YVTN family beta-propeller protein
VGTEPEGVRASPNGRWVVVTNETGNSITLVDAKSFAVLDTIGVGQRPRDVAFTPDSATIYISAEFDAAVYRAALPKGTGSERLLRLGKDDRPMGLALDAARQRLYVSTGRGGTVAVIALQGPKLLKEIKVGKRPWGIALSADGRRLYTANGPSNDVSIVDTSSLTVIKTVPVGSSPWGVVAGG